MHVCGTQPAAIRRFVPQSCGVPEDPRASNVSSELHACRSSELTMIFIEQATRLISLDLKFSFVRVLVHHGHRRRRVSLRLRHRLASRLLKTFPAAPIEVPMLRRVRNGFRPSTVHSPQKKWTPTNHYIIVSLHDVMLACYHHHINASHHCIIASRRQMFMQLLYTRASNLKEVTKCRTRNQ